MASTLAIFNHLDFLPVATSKTLVCAAPVDNEEAFRCHIVGACQTIRKYLSIFEIMQQSMMRRVETCIESHGEHFSHLL
jgi:hypothetical protein